MPFEQAIWRLDENLKRLAPSVIAKEIDLEKYIERDISILNSGWLLIGRQVASDVGPIDLIALDRTGALVVIELKRNQTPRDVTAQALDYAAWIDGLSSDAIAGIYKNYCDRYQPQDRLITLDEAFRRRFNSDLPVEELNHSHQIVLVASELDKRTERIVRYLAGRGIEMNILFFQVFADDDRKLLSRVWLLDDVEIQEQVSRSRTDASAEWNGEYYAAFGVENDSRNWDDARKYGFISAGGGHWYSNTLQLLEPGGRAWVLVPGKGYVGVGEVIGHRQRAAEFFVQNDKGESVSYISVAKCGSKLAKNAEDADKTEFFVPVRWIKTVPLAQAINEVGLFGNQNSVCKPKSPKWLHTVDRLKQLLGVD